MSPATDNIQQLAATSKNFARRLLTIGENRLELFVVEVQEERERLLHAIVLVLCGAACGLLACIALTATVVVVLWPYSPVGALIGVTAFYGVATVCLYLKLGTLLRDWKSLSATRDQLRKDREALQRMVA